MADNITRRLKIYVNGKEVDATITNLRKNLAKFRSASNRAVEGSPEWKKYNAEVAKLESELKQATTAQKAFRQDSKLTTAGISDSQKELTKFTGSFSTMINGYRSGDLMQVQEGFNGVKAGIRGATAAAWKFIATPVGAIIATLAGIGFVAKEWLNYNSAVLKAVETTTAITGLTDVAANQARIQAETLKETYGGDFEQNLKTAKSLVTQFGISYNEAFNIIEEGLQRGQGKNEEYFDSLNEYGTFFKQAGFSAIEFKNIISTGYDLGVYKDKLPDAIKEADLAIKEQSQSTKDALVNAFGAAFTEDLLKRVSIGKTTTKDALSEIAVQSDKANLSVQQNAQLTADLFKGAGEDAGGAIKIFEALNISLNEQQRELTESEQLTADQADATRRLKDLNSALFFSSDKGWGLLVDKAKLFGTKTLIKVLETGVDVYNWLVDLNNESGTFSAILTTLGKTATGPFKIIGILLSNAWDGFKSLGDIIEGIVTLDFEKIKAGVSKGFSAIPSALKEIKQEVASDVGDIYNAFTGKDKMKRLSLSDFTSDNTAGTIIEPTKTNDNAEDGSGEGLTKEDQRKINSKKKLKEWLDQWEKDQELQKEIEDLEKDEANKIKEEFELEEKFAKLQAQAFGEKELLKQLEEAKKLELDAIDKKYADKKLKDKEATDKRYAAIDAANKQKLIKAEENLEQARNNARQFGVSVLRNILGEKSGIFKAMFLLEKGLAIQEIVVNTKKANAQITSNLAIANMKAVAASPLTGGLPFVGINTAIASKEILANNINSGVQIASIAGSAIQSLDKGGYTFEGSYSGGIDGKGGRLMIGHPDEYMLSKPIMQLPEAPMVIEYLEAKAKGGKITSLDKGGTVNGLDEIIETNTPDSYPNNNLAAEISRLNNHLDRGLKINYTLNDEIERQKLEDQLNETILSAKS